MEQQTAMMQLLAQLKDERQNLPMNTEWDRCYQAIEMVIENTYLPMEKEQIEIAHISATCNSSMVEAEYLAEQYYNKTYGNKS